LNCAIFTDFRCSSCITGAMTENYIFLNLIDDSKMTNKKLAGFDKIIYEDFDKCSS